MGWLLGKISGAIRAYAATLPQPAKPKSECIHPAEFRQRGAQNDWCGKCGFYPLSETPAGGTAKVPERETRRVYKADAEEYRSYITARFEKANSGYRFRWLDREWRYEHSDFDERGDFDLLLAAAPSPDGNEESK